MTTTSTTPVGAPPPAAPSPGVPGGTGPPPGPRHPAPPVRPSLAVGLLGLATVLGAVAATTRLGPAGWATAVVCGLLLCALLSSGLARADRDRLLPADVITLARGLLTCAAAAVTVAAPLGARTGAAFLVLAVPALALDAVDGPVARRTGTATPLGARFDGETDAFLVLVLSAAAAPVVGWWVLVAGSARYVFGVAGLVLPWLRQPLPFRYWRKVVTAVVGIVLVVVAGGLLPPGPATVACLAALGLLGESFGRDVWWTWRRRGGPSAATDTGRGRGRVRTGLRTAVLGLPLALGWFAVLAPDRPDRVTALAFLRLPLELLVLAGVLLVVPARARRPVAAAAGLLLGVLGLAKVLDLGTATALGRPFDVVTDLGTLGSGLSFVDASVGRWAAVGAVLAALVLAVTAVVGLPWALSRASAAMVRHRHRRRAGQGLVVLVVAWSVGAAVGLQVAPEQPVAAAGVGPYVDAKVSAAMGTLHERAAFRTDLAADRFADPASGDLSALRGKDVLVVFVESYGRVAVEGPDAEPVRRLLDGYTLRLGARGWSARSAFLTSPTFGGYSWLAHATLQSGLDVDEQGRYDLLLSSDRTTLTSAFARAGWRTVGVVPSTHGTWPEGRAFYHYDSVHGMSDLGYAGPSFGFSGMPDQFALAALDRLELARPHRPVMAEVELTSSHHPWAPLPTLVDRSALGDGSVFAGIHADARTATDLWRDRSDVPAAYRASIAYSLTSLLSFVDHSRDDDLVLLVLGDHQPSTVVSGFGGDRDVPVTLIARDPAVLHRVAVWGWTPGLRPGDAPPVWPMAAVRDEFLSAFSDPVLP